MGNFDKNTKGRAWVGTFQLANMQKTGLAKKYENPEKLADFLIETWENSGKDREAGVSVCVSEKGLYHAHLALYGNLTTLNNVAKIMFDMHTEPQLGGKKNLTAYLLKEAPLIEEKYCVWVVGESGTGKTYNYHTLCDMYGAENIYFKCIKILISVKY